jgi:hypothetical protein
MKFVKQFVFAVHCLSAAEFLRVMGSWLWSLIKQILLE